MCYPNLDCVCEGLI